MWIKGENLTTGQKRQVLSAFVYRLTFENRIRAGKVFSTNTINDVRILVSDEQWIKEHSFCFTKAGELSKRVKSCLPVYMTNEMNQR